MTEPRNEPKNEPRNEPRNKQKTYQGHFYKSGGNGTRFGQRLFSVSGNPLRHFTLHSEATMTWGDSSAESADLALSILWNYFQGPGAFGGQYFIDLEGQRILVSKKSEPAFRLHRAFLHEVVSRWPSNEAWVYTVEDVEHWLEQHTEEMEAWSDDIRST